MGIMGEWKGGKITGSVERCGDEGEEEPILTSTPDEIEDKNVMQL